MTHDDQVTVVMKTYSNSDFTNASVWAIRRYHPAIRVIFADGHPTEPFREKIDSPWKRENLVWIPGASTEDCQNAAVSLVDTEYTLLMDNDCKVISPEALPLCVEALEKWDDVAASGWYGLVVKDWGNREAYVGTDFTDHLELDATQATFSVHRTDMYKAVGGMPKTPFWPSVPTNLWEGKHLSAYTGDYTICTAYRDIGLRVVSPKKAVPVLHWSQAIAWQRGSKAQSPFDEWWLKNCTHTKVNPLNDWKRRNH